MILYDVTITLAIRAEDRRQANERGDEFIECALDTFANVADIDQVWVEDVIPTPSKETA